MQLRLVFCAVLLAASSYGADPGLLNLAMPNAQVMAGVNVDQAKLSPIGQYLLTQIEKEHGSELQMLTDGTGFDPRRDVREILAVSSAQPGTHSGVVLVRGAFDVPRIVEAARTDGQTVDTYKGVEVLHKDKQGSIAFLDSTLAAAGDAADVLAVIDRKLAPSPINPDLALKVNQLSATQDAWFVSLVGPSGLVISGPSNAQFPPNLNMLTKVRQASGGLKLGANVVLSAQAVSDTEKDAAALADVFKLLAGMAQLNASKGEEAAAAALLQNLAVTAEGPITRLSLSVPEQQLEQLAGAAHMREHRK